MNNQLMISVSREFASGGREIAKILAERFKINYYDRNLLDEIASETLGDIDKLRKFDEVPRHRFLTRTFRGMSSSPAETPASSRRARASRSPRPASRKAAPTASP